MANPRNPVKNCEVLERRFKISFGENFIEIMMICNVTKDLDRRRRRKNTDTVAQRSQSTKLVTLGGSKESQRVMR